MRSVVVLALGMIAAVHAGDLAKVKTEPSLEKRSKLALENANADVDAASKAYQAGDVKGAFVAIRDIRDSVDLCRDSLRATGKDARKNPRAFKRAEMDIRELLRRLKSLETDFSVDDRAAILDAQQHLQEVHDDLIQQIMTKRK
jgi:hypothetical protein